MDNNTHTVTTEDNLSPQWSVVGSTFEYVSDDGDTGGLDVSDWEEEGRIVAWIDIMDHRSDVQREFQEGDSDVDADEENGAFARAARWVETYAGMDGSMIPLEDEDEDSVLVNILELVEGQEVDLRFWHDVEGSRRLAGCAGEWEVGHVFLRYWREMNEGDARWSVRAAFSSPGVGEWEAYMYLGDWAYGSSAERFDVRLAS